MKILIKKTQETANQYQGFTLFIAMIVTGLVLAIGFSIGNIVLKELTLSSSGKQSQIAFYAADSIAECALFWDKKQSDATPVGISPFATDTPFTVSPDQEIRCGSGVDVTATSGQIGHFLKIYGDDNGPVNDPNLAANATSTFYAAFRDPGGNASLSSCGKVTIAKTPITTIIEARGYNSNYVGNAVTGSCDLSSPKTVERGLRVKY